MSFISNESGAVTVDWVVLTAALVGLGLATMGVVSSGVEDLSNDVDSELSGTRIYTSFIARNNADLYDAISALNALGVSWAADVNEVLTQNIATIDSGFESDPEGILEELEDYESFLSIANGFSALSRDTATVADFAAIYGAGEATIQNYVNVNHGGDLADYYDVNKAYAEYNVAYYNIVMEKADAANLDYSEYYTP